MIYLSSIRLPLEDKTVLVRVDFNVPLHEEKITDDYRITAVLPTLRFLIHHRAKIVLISHLGRPRGVRCPTLSLKPIAEHLSVLLNQPVHFADLSEAPSKIKKMHPGEILLLENLRFYPEEEANDVSFAQKLAEGSDIYVNEAFSCSHRVHASVVAITKYLPSWGGFLLEKEIAALETLTQNPAQPLTAIIGGAKISTKLPLIDSLKKKATFMAIGGGIANTLAYALGMEIGTSLAERDLNQGALTGDSPLLPIDVVVAISPTAPSEVVLITDVKPNQMILDIGPQTIAALCDVLNRSKTVFWNGPLGLMEVSPFDQGTVIVAQHVADLTRKGDLISIAGGGDTAAILRHAGVFDDFTYVSTAGGAFLEWIEGATLPGLHALGES